MHPTMTTSCPFCGKLAISRRVSSVRETDGHSKVHMECQDCFATSPYFETAEEAVRSFEKLKQSPYLYGRTGFLPGDVLPFRPDWSDDQAEEFLYNNEKYIQEAMVSAGFSAIEALIPIEGEDDE